MVEFVLLPNMVVVARSGLPAPLTPLRVETLSLLRSKSRLGSGKAGNANGISSVLKATNSGVFFGIGRLASARAVESWAVGTQPLGPCETATTEVTVKWHYITD